jgi:hypothetical protein
MYFLRRVLVSLFAVANTAMASAWAAEPVGEAVLIRTSVVGGKGDILVKSPIHRDERISTSKSGLGEFVFRDGTKFAVGWGSSVVVDQYVFNDDKSVKKLAINAAKGTFRWISGNSDPSSYSIETPAGTLGVRGTALDVFVAEDGITAVVLLDGLARFCGGANGSDCKDLKRRCDFIVAVPGGDVSNPRRVSEKILEIVRQKQALPFLTGFQQLSSDFLANDKACRLTTAALEEDDWTKVPPGGSVPDDLDVGDDIEVTVGSAIHNRGTIVSVQAFGSEVRYFTAPVTQKGWRKAITAYRRADKRTAGVKQNQCAADGACPPSQ